MRRRIEREQRTVSVMIKMYCRDQHSHEDGLCEKCHELDQYAIGRTLRCPFGKDKPVCSLCMVHCYNREKREKIRRVMRYAGPRMIIRHPVLGILHLADKQLYKTNKKHIIQ